MFMNLSGLKMFLPSTPADLKGLLKTAIRDNNPVISFESNRLLATKGPVPDGDYTIPLGVADIKRKGSDVTVVALAWLVHEALAAAEELAKEGDLGRGRRSAHAGAARLRRRSAPRCARRAGSSIADEAGPTAGFSAEVAAVVTEDAATFARLKAPVKRVCALQRADPLQPRARGSRLPGPQAHHRRHTRRAQRAATQYGRLNENMRQEAVGPPGSRRLLPIAYCRLPPRSAP